MTENENERNREKIQRARKRNDQFKHELREQKEQPRRRLSNLALFVHLFFGCVQFFLFFG